jgi:hypothetical protein
MNIHCGIHAQTEVMKARRVGFMSRGHAGRPQHETEVSIEILDVPVTRDGEFVLAKAEDLDHYSVVELL